MQASFCSRCSVISCQDKKSNISFMARSKCIALQSYNFSPMECNSLAENRVSLNIFNYHTWVEYEKYTRICIISLLGDTEELNISQSILFINVIFNEIYSRLSQLNRTFALSIKAKWIIRIITV